MTDTLHLDKRQRAMLAEMGVRVWSPMSEAAVMARLRWKPWWLTHLLRPLPKW